MRFGLRKDQHDSISKVFYSHPNLDKVVLFGSRAKGNYHAGSDIDLAMIGNNLKLDEIFQIESELESLSFPTKFDLVLYKSLSDQEVVEHMKRVGRLFYKRYGLREKGLLPIISKNSRILILGSFPSEQSLFKEQYYANPTNQFWEILFNIYNKPFHPEYKDKTDFILESRFALWDVIESCIRDGSTDKKIKSEVVNDFDQLFTNFPNVTHLFFNGKHAFKFFVKHYSKANKFGFSLCLPSTSRLNTHLTIDQKIEKWRIINSNII
jgi:hypoxanthine-DNA glycosylase